MEATNVWIKTFCSFFNINFNVEEYSIMFGNLFHLHFHAVLFDGPSILFDNKNNIQLINHFQLYSKKIKDFYNILLQNKKLAPIFQKRDLLFPRYLCLIQKYINYSSFGKKIRVYVSSIYGTVFEEDLGNMIKKRNAGMIEIINDIEKEIDLIISDRIYPVLKNKNIPIFIWHDIPNNTDWENLSSFLATFP